MMAPSSSLGSSSHRSASSLALPSAAAGGRRDGSDVLG
jgi:hypothetical protein